MKLVAILSFFLISCGFHNSVPDFLPNVYQMDIQQGNEIDSEMLLQLKPGMTKSQVRFVLGTPLIQDSFHKQRWDYVYAMRKGGVLIEKRHIIVNFEKDLLKNITGEVIPKDKKRPVVNKKELNNPSNLEDGNNDESSWIEKIKFWEDDTNITDDKDVNHEKNSNTEAGEIINEGSVPNNVDLIQKIDVKESINEAVKADIENNESQDLLSDKKILSEDKEVIINPKTDAKESDYFKLLLEKIGF